MRHRFLRILTMISFLALIGQFAHANGYDAWDRDGGEPNCTPNFSTPIAAQLYSYQVPVLIRDERTREDTWAYAYACVKAPLGWFPGDEVAKADREGDTWSNLLIQTPNPQSTWAFQYPPNEANRSQRDTDDFGQPFSAYIPLPDSRGAMLAEVPQKISLGITPTTASLLRSAGVIVADDRAWPEHSLNASTREGWPDVQPRRFLKGWLNASPLLCDGTTKRTGYNDNLVRALMVRDPQFDWTLSADPISCANPTKNKTGNDLRKWGGGIMAFYLFPNIAMGPLEAINENGKLTIKGSLINGSAATGPVALYYRWDSSGAGWRNTGKVVTIQPYADSAFTLPLDWPQAPDRLTLFAWPKPETGLTLFEPTAELLADDWASPLRFSSEAALDEALSTVTIETTTGDNRRSVSVSVQPQTCELFIQLHTPASSTPDGFDFTVTVKRVGCEGLTVVQVDVLEEGDHLNDHLKDGARFTGDEGTVTMWSGPLPGLTSVTLTATVDPKQTVAQKSRAHNTDTATVIVEVPPPATKASDCPLGKPSYDCFGSRITK